ncbi:aldehyde ferredoxin oxidoreductase family protein [Thermodesulfobacteriota bacterium]
MMNGYNGKFLRVNLTNGQITVEEPPEDYYRRYIGGRGFIVEKLLTEMPAKIDPLGPENKLIFSLGPLSGQAIPGGGRNSIGAKSPLTGAFGEAEAGGFFGASLKRAGFDALIIDGASPKPVYLKIENGQAEIRDGAKIWGLDIADAQNAVQEELGSKNYHTAAIGQAGENLVRFACVINDVSHAAGRTGLGAVMGSKKLKLVAVRGNKSPDMAERDKILDMSRELTQRAKNNPSPMSINGTGAAMAQYESIGNLPIRNFQGGYFPNAADLSPKTMKDRGYWDKMESCYGCPIKCKKKLNRLTEPWPVDPIYGGPEYETLAALGSNCGIDSVEAVIKGHELCGRYGLDTISAGATIAFAMECMEKGILTTEDADGVDLNFGNADAMLEMLERIAFRKGFGDTLAEGTRKASQIIGKGSEDFALHVKGNELPMHEPRLKQGLGLHYSAHASGADHCTGIHDVLIKGQLKAINSVDIADDIPATELSPRKVRMLYMFGMWRQVANYLGVCIFVPWSQKQLTEATEYITGWPMSYYRLMKTAERGMTLSRIFNYREGITNKDDTLPKRFFSAPADGPLKAAVDPEQLAEAQKLYYQMLGWDESGVPTYARLVELDIEWAHEYIEKAKKIA